MSKQPSAACTGQSYSIYILALLVLINFNAKLDSYALVSTNQSLAAELKFGDTECVSWNQTSYGTRTMSHLFQQPAIWNHSYDCSGLKKKMCEKNFNCRLHYMGTGTSYDVLAGPLFTILNSICGVVIGVFTGITRGSRKTILAVCTLSWSVMTVLCAFATEYWHVAATRLGLGLFIGGCTPLAASIIADHFQQLQRGSALSVFNWGVYLGFGLSLSLIMIRNSIGWRFVYIIAGIPGLVLAVLVFLTVKEPKDDKRYTESVKETLASSLKNLKETTFIFSTPSILLLCIGGSIRNGAGNVWAYEVINFATIYHPGLQVERLMSWISPVFGIIGSILGGILSDRFAMKWGLNGRVCVLIVGQILAIPFAVCTLLLNTPWAFFFQIPTYVCGETWIGVIIALLVDMVPGEHKTATVAIYEFFVSIIGGNLILLVSPIQHAAGLRTALLVTYPGLYLLGVLFFIPLIFLVKHELSGFQVSIDNISKEKTPLLDGKLHDQEK